MLRSEIEKSWLEATLERRLGRVGAPVELWDRVQFPRTSSVRRSAFAPLAAALVVIAVMWGFHLKSGGAAVQFRSHDPEAVRAWVKANTGLDVPLHSGQLAGARVVPGRVAAAEITYRAGSHDVSVLVSTAGANSATRGRLVSWNARGQNYSLAFDALEDLKGCMLCHVGS